MFLLHQMSNKCNEYIHVRATVVPGTSSEAQPYREDHTIDLDVQLSALGRSNTEIQTALCLPAA